MCNVSHSLTKSVHEAVNFQCVRRATLCLTKVEIYERDAPTSLISCLALHHHIGDGVGKDKNAGSQTGAVNMLVWLLGLISGKWSTIKLSFLPLALGSLKKGEHRSR